MNGINWMNEGTEADRIERAIRWTTLVNYDKKTLAPRFHSIVPYTAWLRWYEAGQDWLAGPLMASKFRERQLGKRTETGIPTKKG